MGTKAIVVLIIGLALTSVHLADAQQAGKIPRVGILGSVSASGSTTRIESLRAGLRDLGYVEGKNIVIEFRWAEGNYDRLPELAAELARLNVDVLVTHGVPGSLAAKRATRRFRLSWRTLAMRLPWASSPVSRDPAETSPE